MKPKVLVSRRIQEGPLTLLREQAEVMVNPEDRAMTPEEFIANLPGKVGLLAAGIDPLSAKILEAGRDLKIVANNAVGFNNIDLAAATHLKIATTNTPEVLTDTTADLAFALMLGVLAGWGKPNDLCGRVNGSDFIRTFSWEVMCTGKPWESSVWGESGPLSPNGP